MCPQQVDGVPLAILDPHSGHQLKLDAEQAMLHGEQPSWT